jgi:hypothetical protein
MLGWALAWSGCLGAGVDELAFEQHEPPHLQLPAVDGGEIPSSCRAEAAVDARDARGRLLPGATVRSGDGTSTVDVPTSGS